jgi:hypothetical protein
MYQTSEAARLLPNPLCHRLIATPGADHNIWPGSLQIAGLTTIDPHKRRLSAEMTQQLPGSGRYELLYAAQVQFRRQRAHLRIIAGFLPQQTPDC